MGNLKSQNSRRQRANYRVWRLKHWLEEHGITSYDDLPPGTKTLLPFVLIGFLIVFIGWLLGVE